MKALFTTEADFSAKYFEKHGWDIILYNSDWIMDNNYKTVYFRDPFNTSSNIHNEKTIDGLIKHFDNVSSIDGIRSFNDMYLIEDKWMQAQKYKEFMPNSYLPSEHKFVAGKMLIKKRISQRAKDIKFQLDSIVDDSWIIQELVDIKEELRVYCIFGEILPDATIKTSKSSGKVKVIGFRPLAKNEIEFCQKISNNSGLDFIGLDVAVTTEGELKLIEVNRSPQFNRFIDYCGEEKLAKILDL